MVDKIGRWRRVYDGLLPVLKQCMEKAEILSADLNLHSFRKTFITRLLSKGVPPHVVQKLAGHSTPNLTLAVYAKVRTDDFEKAIETLDMN